MDDLISREAAIDAINKLIDRFERILCDIRENNEDESVCGLCEYDGTFIGQSGDWCNECPGFDKADCFKLSDECRKKWLKELDIPTIEERKTGRWVKVGGYCTPGGDPVWRCSECGLGQHVWGIEAGTYGAGVAEHQWVSCPNCGADMRGEEHE